MILMTRNQWKCDTNRPAWEARSGDGSAPTRVPGLARAYSTRRPDGIAMQESSPLRRAAVARDAGICPVFLPVGGDTPLLYALGHRL